jgi:hypothetical protein
VLAHFNDPRRGGLTKRKNMDSRLIDMLACPVSKAPVFFSAERQLIVCPTSKLAYPIKDGIPAADFDAIVRPEDMLAPK